MPSRRSFLLTVGAAAGLATTRVAAQRGREGSAPAGPLPPSLAALTSMRDRARPITADERRARIERAKQIMAEQKIDAIILAGGTSLTYFTGIRWGNSERLAGGPMEHTDVAIWQEDESPFERVAQGLKDRGIATGRLGVEETMKFVFADSIAAAAPGLHITTATPVTAGCRMIKTAHELELMRVACEATLKCYEAVFHAVQPGMTQNEVSRLIDA